jgi:hypothetical protein
VFNALYHLHSIILVPSSFEEAPRIYHPSFQDFITDSRRCSEPRFLVDIPEHQKFLVLRCLDVMISDIKFKSHILHIGNSYYFQSEIGSLKNAIDESVPAEVRYSCLHWTFHLSKVIVGDEEVIKVLKDFASEKLLNWMEVMSLSGLVASDMRDAREWAVSQCLCLRAECTKYLQRLNQSAVVGLLRY